MVATMRMLSYLAITATLLWLFGALAMLQQCIQMPSQWAELPAYTNFWSTVMFFGTAMYSYEGQTMVSASGIPLDLIVLMTGFIPDTSH